MQNGLPYLARLPAGRCTVHLEMPRIRKHLGEQIAAAFPISGLVYEQRKRWRESDAMNAHVESPQCCRVRNGRF